MSEQTPPPPKRQKVENASETPVAVSSPPSTPILKGGGVSKRVIPDTPGSPYVQVPASSPAAVDGTPRVTKVATPSVGGPVVPGIGRGNTVRPQPNNSNTTAAAIAEAMKLASPHFSQGPSIRRPGFPSQTPSSPQTIIPESPPQPRFGGYISQFQYNPQLQPLPTAPIPQPTYLGQRPISASIASAYGMPNRPRPIQSRPGQYQPLAQLQPRPPLDTRPKEGTPLRRLVDMFPGVTESQALNTLTAFRGNFEDAAMKLTEDPTFGLPQRLPTVTQPRYQQQQQQKASSHQQQIYGTPPPVAIQSTTTKRTLKAPNQTIQQKYTHLNQSQSVPTTYPYNIIQNPLPQVTPFGGPPAALTQFSKSPSKSTQSKKRKLVRGGGSRKLDSDGDSLSEEEEEEEEEYRDTAFDEKVLNFLNTSSPEEVGDISFTPAEQIEVFLSHRPFGSLEISRAVEIPPTEDTEDSEPKKRGVRARRAAKKGRNIGNRIVDGVEQVLRGYNGVDDLITECEAIGKRVREKLAKWTSAAKEMQDDGALTLTCINASTPSTSTTDPSPAPSEKDLSEFVPTIQSGILAEDVQLKDYQIIGVNWLHLLYAQGLSCILADEMGLGKTCQVIAFLGGLLERTGGQRGKHLVVVPSSTIENWLREFKRFCPSLVVEPYYGDQNTRAELRYNLQERKDEFHVIVTTYKLATGAKEDRKFLKEFKFDVCIYDEGHMLKNSLSKQYIELMKISANFRILLTGTPLQNNLTELISLLSFILPTVFAKNRDSLQSIFKLKPSSSLGASAALLSQQRIARAKAMMTPFVLRRRKIHVLKDLPKKSHQVEYCEMVPQQRKIYDEILQKQKDQIAARASGDLSTTRDANNVLMQLRKAASHPLLFRKIYTDAKLKTMAKDIMKEDKFSTPEHTKEAILEDMTYMWDFPLHKLCLEHPSISKYALKNEEWMQAGKVEMLKKLLPEMKARGDRVLLFSFFTMMLDILEKVLDSLGIQYMRLDGQTKVDERQDMIDQFHEEEDITVFLLSTKAGGFGINLACANVVIIFDGSFNPHDDKQAEDRAHRVGQTRDVTVIRLVSKDTIEEHILHLANTKLALDQEMSGTIVENIEDDEKAEMDGEKFVARMLIGKNGEDTPAGGSAVPSRVVTPALAE